VRVKTAIPTLSNAELANLSARAQHAQQDFAAGRLSNLMIGLIIVLVVLVILLAAYH
jgi:CHASE3 domain sensor protein